MRSCEVELCQPETGSWSWFRLRHEVCGQSHSLRGPLNALPCPRGDLKRVLVLLPLRPFGVTGREDPVETSRRRNVMNQLAQLLGVVEDVGELAKRIGGNGDDYQTLAAEDIAAFTVVERR